MVQKNDKPTQNTCYDKKPLSLKSTVELKFTPRNGLENGPFIDRNNVPLLEQM